MNRRGFLGWTGGALLGAGLFPGWRRRLPPVDRYVERWSWAMGQPVRIQLFASSEDQGLEAAHAAFATLREVEQCLSLFDDASDLSELNRRAGTGWFTADRDLLALLTHAQRMQQETDGVFDLAVEPLMRAYGFHRLRTTPPSPQEVAEAREAVQAARIVIDGPRVSLPASHTRLDAGGIGVGYGLDRAAGVLRRFGISAALIDISGDLLALDAPPGRNGWPVTIVDSADPARIVAEVPLRHAALATSSNQVSVMRFGGQIFGHVIDPRTGVPATAYRQTSVLASTGVVADAGSTALLVAVPRRPVGRAVWTLPAV